MDKLGAYTLVAALKEISKKNAQPANEKWISLRSCMSELSPVNQEALNAQPHAADAPAGSAVTPPVQPPRSYTYIRQINQRHQEVKKLL